MRIANLLRASLESEATDVTIGQDELAVNGKLAVIAQEVNDQPTAAEVVSDVETVTTAVDVLDEIVEMRDSGDTVAMEAAAYGLSVFQRTHGIHQSVGVESLHGDSIPFLRESILVAATESLEKDIKKMHDKFDINRKSIIETRALLNRVRGEMSRYAGTYDNRELTLNLAGVLSYFSRNMTPTTDVVAEIKTELENIKTMRNAFVKVKDRLVKLAKDANALPVTLEGVNQFNSMLNEFNISDVANELEKLDLLNSGKITTDFVNSGSSSNLYLTMEYHLVKDGTNLGLKNWLKIAGKALLSEIAGRIVTGATGSSGLGTLTSIGGLLLTAKQGFDKKKEIQGTNHHILHSYKELEEYLNVVDDIMNYVLRDNASNNELKNAARSLYNKAKQLSKFDRGGEFVEMGKKALAVVGNALAKRHLGVDANLDVDESLVAMEENVFAVEMACVSIEEIVEMHCIVTGACAVSLCNNILTAVKNQ